MWSRVIEEFQIQSLSEGSGQSPCDHWRYSENNRQTRKTDH